ncbi:MAG: hypothetical protein WC943_17195, partial [Elusimicrobiota bacterium]
NQEQILNFTVYNGKLYAGQGANAGDGDVLVFDGSSWTTSYDGNQEWIYSLAAYNGKLYAGQGNAAGDGDVLVFDGSSWTKSYDGNQELIYSLAAYNGKLYAGQGTNAGDGDVLAFDGSSWTTSYDGNQEYIRSLAVFNGKLYAGQGIGVGDGDVLAFDGSSWTTSYDGNQEYINSLAAYNGKLYAGQGNSAGDGDVLDLTPASSGTLTGWDGIATAQTLTFKDLLLAISTNSETCGGVSPCGATNQVVFTFSDMAGNVRTYGPFAVLVQLKPEWISPAHDAGFTLNRRFKSWFKTPEAGAASWTDAKVTFSTSANFDAFISTTFQQSVADPSGQWTPAPPWTPGTTVYFVPQMDLTAETTTLYLRSAVFGDSWSGWADSLRVLLKGAWTWTDPAITGGVTPAKTAHVSELRDVATGIRAFRNVVSTCAFSVPAWTDDPLTGGVSAIKNTHVTELRSAVAPVVTCVTGEGPAYTDPTLTPGVTPVRSLHITELRTEAAKP